MLKPILTKPVHGILHSVVNHAPRVQGKNIITAVIVPSLGMLRDGDEIGDFISADIDSAANYASIEGTISSVDVAITVNGSAATTATTVNYTDNVQITVTVTDSAANQRVWVRTRMVAGIVPVNTSAVSISGDVELDGVLTVAAGSWTGVPVPDLTYQWLRDEQPIIGATGTAYTISMTDSETVISVRETATNSAGAESVVSNIVAVPDLDQPVDPEREITIAFINKTSSSIAVSINANFVIGEYDVLVNGNVWTNTFGNESGVDVTGLDADTQYTIQISYDGVLSNIITETTESAIEPEPTSVVYDFSEYANNTALVDQPDWTGWNYPSRTDEDRRLVVLNGLLRASGTAQTADGNNNLNFSNGAAIYTDVDQDVLSFSVDLNVRDSGSGTLSFIVAYSSPTDFIFFQITFNNTDTIYRLRRFTGAGSGDTLITVGTPSPIIRGSNNLSARFDRANGSLSYSVDTGDGRLIVDSTGIDYLGQPFVFGIGSHTLMTSHNGISKVVIGAEPESWQEPEEIYNGLNAEIVNGDAVINTDRAGTIYYLVNQSPDDLTPEFIQSNATGSFETVAGSDLTTQSETGWFHAVLWDGTEYSNVVKLEVA